MLPCAKVLATHEREQAPAQVACAISRRALLAIQQMRIFAGCPFPYDFFCLFGFELIYARAAANLRGAAGETKCWKINSLHATPYCKLNKHHPLLCFSIGSNSGFTCPDGSAVPSLYNLVEDVPNTYYYVNSEGNQLYSEALTTCGGKIFIARTQEDWTDLLTLAKSKHFY